MSDKDREDGQWRQYYYEQVALAKRLSDEIDLVLKERIKELEVRVHNQRITIEELKEQRDRDMQMIVDLQSTIDAYGKEK